MNPLPIPIPPDLQHHPELAVLLALDAVLHSASASLCAQYPEILPPDWSTDSPRPPEPSAYMANVLLTLIHSLGDAIRTYRQTIARCPPFDPSPDHPDDGICF